MIDRLILPMGRQYQVTGYELNPDTAYTSVVHRISHSRYMYVLQRFDQVGLVSLENKLSALDFVLQLWNTNLEQKLWAKARAGLHCQRSQVET